MIQAEEFLRLAESYATGKSEADWRSAVTRPAAVWILEEFFAARSVR